MTRDPLVDPQPGDVVQSAYYDGTKQVGRRMVISATSANISYSTGTGCRIVNRNSLPSTWRKWCREHRAKVVTDDRRDYRYDDRRRELMGTAYTDDGATSSQRDVSDMLRTALNKIRAVATTGSDDTDRHLLAAEQHLRAAIRELAEAN